MGLLPNLAAENSLAVADVLDHLACGVVSDFVISRVNVSSTRAETLPVRAWI
jgi:hypothetical protein